MAVDLLKTITDTLPLPGKKPAQVAPELSEAEKIARGMVSVRDILAPGAMEIDFTYLHIGDTYYRTLFVAGYPRQVGANWLSPLINFGSSLDISMFYYPVTTKLVLKKLRRKITEMEAELLTEEQSGKIADPEVELNLEDATGLQDELVEGSEKFFQFALYITIPASSLDELNSITKQIESVLGGMLLLSKPATLQMNEGFRSTLPTFEDTLQVSRNMDTTSLATTFPFTSSELTANEGVMYGLNEHNGSLVVFDRFNLENANMVIFAKSGAGKSYAVKLETMRSLMLGVEVIVIDPENEYKTMAQAIGGSYIPFDFNSHVNINPFDLSQVYEQGENELGLKILNLHGLIRVMFGELNPTEDNVVDRALVMTYKLKGITPDPDTQKNEPPLLEDLYKVFLGMEEPEAKGLADRLEKYVKGSAAGLFDKPSNIDLNNTFTVFGIRDLEDEVRPVAMYVILDYIWTHIRRNKKKRLLVIDEAWFLMQNPDSAKFVNSLAKRARKYYLGLTTITQDVEDFIATDMGKSVVNNASLQFLMKQSTASVDKLTEVFYLSSGEKNLLLSSNVGEGLFFAGSAHVAVQVIASPEEHRLITTNPKELQAMAEEDSEEAAKISQMLAGESPGSTMPSEPPVEGDDGSAGPQPVQDDSQPANGLTNQSAGNHGLNDATAAVEGTSAVHGGTQAPAYPLSPTPPAAGPAPFISDFDAPMTQKSDKRIGSPDLPLPQPGAHRPDAAPSSAVTPSPTPSSSMPHALPHVSLMPETAKDEDEDKDEDAKPAAVESAAANSAMPTPQPPNRGSSNGSGAIDIFAQSPMGGNATTTPLSPTPGATAAANNTASTAPVRKSLQFVRGKK